MKIGIIGLSGVGKTSLFNALTKSSASVAGGRNSAPNISTIRVPDERIDKLSEVYKPKKTSYANVEFVDIAGVIPGGAAQATAENNLLNNIRPVDVICHVIRVFDEDCEQLTDPVNIVGDIKKINDELLLSDLAMIESRISRMNQKKKTPVSELEQKLLEKLKAHLESEQMLFTLELNADEQVLLQGFKFLSQKKQIVVLNIDEKYIKTDINSKYSDAIAYLKKLETPHIQISAKIEMEISQLEGDDEKLFLEENGLAEPGRNRLIRLAYEVLGNISFFTAGEDEVKAWTIQKNDSAHEAAGKIHSDIQRGFIKAEVVSYADFLGHGSVEKAKAAGKYRLEPKHYTVVDGDIINFRFNV
ncbi:MAG: hypothetical protein ACD_47C00379G0003 [uncultured bacterium]|nr:MAG: hypothetical protein ACD_47C00379G0003 [uncultured bacterium]